MNLFPITDRWATVCGMSNYACQNLGYLMADCSCACPPGTSGSHCETLSLPYTGEGGVSPLLLLYKELQTDFSQHKVSVMEVVGDAVWMKHKYMRVFININIWDILELGCVTKYHSNTLSTLDIMTCLVPIQMDWGVARSNKRALHPKLSTL